MANYFDPTESAEVIASDILRDLDGMFEDEDPDITLGPRIYDVQIGRGIIELLGKIAHELEVANKAKD